MSDDARERERKLREDLDAQAEKVIVEGSGELVTPRRLGHMVSLRLEPDLATRLRELATQREVSMSELLREGAALLLSQSEQMPRSSYHYVVHGAQTFTGRTAAPAGQLVPSR